MKKYVFMLFIMLTSVRSWGGNPLMNPIMVTDPVRSLASFVLTLLKVGQNPSLGAWINVTQEEVAGYVGERGGGAGEEAVNQGSSATAVPAQTYDYVLENVFKGQATPYAPLNSKLGGDMKAVVKDMFFWTGEANALTEAKRVEIKKKRTDYLTTLGKEYTKMAYEVQQKVMENMNSVSANIGGSGTIGEISALDQTWRSINKTLIADIAIQIQLMELDAAKFLSIQPVEYMPVTEKKVKNGKTEEVEVCQAQAKQ